MSRLMDIMDDYLGIYNPEPEYFTFPFLKERQRDSGPPPVEGRPNYEKRTESDKPIETRWSKYQKKNVAKIRTRSFYEMIKAEREEKKRQDEESKAVKINWSGINNHIHINDNPNCITGPRCVRRGGKTIMAY